jgi:ketosteroid isomerase-like protein
MHRVQTTALLHNFLRGCGPLCRSAAVALALLLLGTATLSAAPSPDKNKPQKNQKDSKNKDKGGAASPIDVEPIAPLPDPQAIELMVSQMLGAWQVGDADLMHNFYSDDVLVVSGAFEPPLQGWQSYAQAYMAQRSHMQAAQLDRMNTFTKVDGDTAWCTYQWRFGGLVDGNRVDSVGHTTLVLEKHAGKWLIVLNHTSTAPMPQESTAVQPPAH